jgi:hypothetical protein
MPVFSLFTLTKEEWDPLLKSKFSTSIKRGKVKQPTAFSERGLYIHLKSALHITSILPAHLKQRRRNLP